MGMIKEFREFAMQGSVMDLAIGVVIGASFGKIVTSLVDDVIMPPVGLLMGGVNFADLKLTLKEAAGETPAVAINYGAFLQVVIQFLIVAWVIFMIVKAINSAKARVTKPVAVTEPVVKECPYCLAEIPIKATKCQFCTSQL